MEVPLRPCALKSELAASRRRERMLWPGVRVARAPWRGVEEPAERKRECSGRLRPRVLFPLSLILVNRRLPSLRELFVYHTNKYRKGSELTCHEGEGDRLHCQ